MHQVAIGGQLLLLGLVGSVQESTLAVGHIVELSCVRDVTWAVWYLEAGKLLAVHSIVVHVLASTHERVARGEVFEVLVVEFSNINVEGLWSLALTDVESIECVHGFHKRLLPLMVHLLDVPLLWGLMH